MNSIASLLTFDKKHIWHPYTSMIDPLPVYPVRSAHDVHIVLEDGRELIDGMSSWWCAIHGYNHPQLNEAIEKQLKSMSHVMFGGLTHEPAIRLSQKLVGIAKGNTQKSKLMTIKKGYHGDTFGAMSVCDPLNGMHHVFSHVLPQHIFVKEPSSRFSEPDSPNGGSLNNNDLTNLENAFEQHHQEVAAFILEPIVQGAGGMRIYSPAFLKKVKSLCEQYGILLIADEIATGFGRTGKWFACNHAQVTPDILCLGKALTGGMMTMAATLCTEEVANTICSGELGVFMHGPTFMANPLACSVALASINLLETNHWQEKVYKIESILKQKLQPCLDSTFVNEVRILGAIGVVECKYPVDVPAIQKFFVANGVWIRPFRNLIYIMPPFIIEEKELVQLCEIIYASLAYKEHFKYPKDR